MAEKSEEKAPSPTPKPGFFLFSLPWSSIFTYLAIAAAAGYIWVVGSNMWTLFNPEHVSESTPGHSNLYKTGEPLDLYLFASSKNQLCYNPSETNLCKLVWNETNFRYGYDNGTITKVVTIPRDLLKSASSSKPLYMHAWFAKPGTKPPIFGGEIDYNNVIASVGVITKFMKERKRAVNLLKDQPQPPPENESEQKMKLHYAGEINFALVVDQTRYPKQGFPGDYAHMVRLANDGHYFPIVFYNTFLLSQSKYEVVNKSANANDTRMAVKISTISVGSFRLYSQMSLAQQMLKDQYGMSDTDLDAVRDLLFNNSPTILAVTLFVTVIHILFDFLAFKNDIGYWKKRKTMQGLSTRSVVLSAVTQIVVFFYLQDNEASLLVTAPAGIQAIIDIWKVKKALKLEVKWAWGLVPIGIGHGIRVSQEESVTEEADIIATKYMTYALYPLMLCYSIYSLVYDVHRGFYSWILSTLTGYIYAFGFIMMTPQLFINYKLKSVAHLPWRALGYKAFNTFIDDVFAFIIHMPTMHRLACLRDDVVFLCFLYQRWIYPVDASRVNEFGFSGEDVEEAEMLKKQNALSGKETSSDNDGSSEASTNEKEPEEKGGEGGKAEKNPSGVEKVEGGQKEKQDAEAKLMPSAEPAQTTVRKRVKKAD